MDFIANELSRRYASRVLREPQHIYRPSLRDGGGSHGHARGRKPGLYLSQLVDRLELAEGESLLDVGCGAGTLAVPLAKEGHRIIAIDISSELLDALRAYAAQEGVFIETIQRSWDDEWEGIPRADVALASRSLITSDLPHALSNLEAHAAGRVVVTSAAGQSPWRDRLFLTAIGREEAAAYTETSFDLICDYLASMGRTPHTSYIRYRRRWSASTREELVDTLLRILEDVTAGERATTEIFVEQHALWNEATKRFSLDYEQQIEWGVATWKIC